MTTGLPTGPLAPPLDGRAAAPLDNPSSQGSTYQSGNPVQTNGASSPLPFLGIGLGLGYHTLLVGGERASTWGQRLMGLRVVTSEGMAPGTVQAFVQALLFYATVTVATPLILLVGLFNAKGSLIQDFLSALVVSKRG